MEHRRSMMQGGAYTPLKNGQRVFEHTNQLEISDGHYVRLVHPRVAFAMILNISDMFYNSSNETTQDNNNSTAVWLRLKKGDVVFFRFTVKDIQYKGTYSVNFTTRLAGGTTLEKIFGTIPMNTLQVGTVMEHTYIPSDDVTIASLCTWHSYSGSKSFDITWDAEIYVNGKRVV